MCFTIRESFCVPKIKKKISRKNEENEYTLETRGSYKADRFSLLDFNCVS